MNFSKNSGAGCINIKINYLCELKTAYKIQVKDKWYEKDISAIEKEKSEQAWFQGKDVHRQRQKGSCCTQGQGQKEAYCFKWTKIEIIKGLILLKGARV